MAHISGYVGPPVAAAKLSVLKCMEVACCSLLVVLTPKAFFGTSLANLQMAVQHPMRRCYVSSRGVPFESSFILRLLIYFQRESPTKYIDSLILCK